MSPADSTPDSTTGRAVRRALRATVAGLCLLATPATLLAQPDPDSSAKTVTAPASEAANVVQQRPAMLYVPEQTKREFASLPAGKRLRILGRLIRKKTLT